MAGRHGLKGKKMELNLQGRKITVDSAYLLMASAVCFLDFPNGEQNAREFFVCGFDTVMEARRHGRKIQNYPGIESVWIIRRKDMEVVQPHEKF
ncbi:MAG: hypothetical protein IPQ08_06440 [Chitinophagaceae bacterium]|nr:hypothetical protein [Chitinophagaceae bacterium]